MATIEQATRRTPPPSGWFDQQQPGVNQPGAGGHSTLNPIGGGGRTPPPSTGDPLDLIAQFQAGLPPTPDSVATIVAMLRAQGIPAALATHKGGTAASSDAIVLPDGRVIDVVRGWDGPDPQWTTAHVDNYAGTRNVIGANGEFVPFSTYMQGLGLPMPTARPFAGGGGGGAGGGGGGTGGGGGAGYMAGLDPSYDWRFKEGQKALERSASARGTLLGGGALKDLVAYGQGMASTEFGNIFNRNYQLAGLGLNATTRAGDSASAYRDAAERNLTGAGNAAAAGTVGKSNAWTNTLGALGDIAGQWALSRGGRGPRRAPSPVPSPLPWYNQDGSLEM